MLEFPTRPVHGRCPHLDPETPFTMRIIDHGALRHCCGQRGGERPGEGVLFLERIHCPHTSAFPVIIKLTIVLPNITRVAQY